MFLLPPLSLRYEKEAKWKIASYRGRGKGKGTGKGREVQLQGKEILTGEVERT